MPIVTPIPIDALPPAPQPTDTAPDFDSKSFAMIGALAPFVSQTNALAAATEGNATSAFGSATTASSAAVSAANAAAAAVGASNFKDLWSSMTGALSKPATVKHNGRFWLLLNDLADVTLSEPGVTADWTSSDAGTVPTQVITSNTTAIAGVRYIVAAPSITLTAPTVWVEGDLFSISEVITGSTYDIDFGATKVRGVVVGLVTIDAALSSFAMQYKNATLGLI